MDTCDEYEYKYVRQVFNTRYSLIYQIEHNNNIIFKHLAQTKQS